jgi:parvulin-like peptidyl-prolyl isomerase
MRRSSLLVIAMLVLFWLFPPGGYASPARADLPLVGGKPVLARINGEPLTLEEFERALAGIHTGMADNSQRSLPHPSQLLDRLINAKLVLQEARNIGLDELPEVQSAEKAFEEDTLRGMLYGFHVRNILKPDPKEVEKRYRDAVKEVKAISVLFDKEEDAKRLESDVKAAGKFEELAQEMISEKVAQGSVEGQYLKFSSLSPEVAKAVSLLKKGEVSPLIPIGKQFSLLKLEDIRYPQDKAAREQAEKEALQVKRVSSLKKYTEGLRKKYVKIDQKVFDSLDFESAEPVFEKLRTDGRVLATVKGEKPVTVGNLTATLEKKFFHGAERAAGKKKINRMKDQVLEEILNKRVTLLEAKKQKLERTEYFKGRAQENRNDVLFGAFVQKVIAPDVKVDDEELKEFYQAHIGEYTFPEMVRVDGLLFSDKGTAEEAIEKLRKGADFQWLRTNAEGQVDPAKGENLLEFKAQLLDATTLPEGIRKAISGAAPGEYRLYADPGNAYYVLGLVERFPSKPLPLETVKGELEKKVFAEKLQRVLRDWEEKLRKASDVKIYATGKKLDRIVTPLAK